MGGWVTDSLEVPLEDHVRLIEEDPAYKERWFEKLAKTVAVDFDGVIHPYTDGWQGFVPADEPPMPGVEEFLAQLSSEGYQIIVFSTRCDTQAGTNGTKAWLEKWGLDKYIQMVTCRKPAAIAYVDDRAVPYKGDFGDCHQDILDLVAGRAHGAAQR